MGKTCKMLVVSALVLLWIFGSSVSIVWFVFGVYDLVRGLSPLRDLLITIITGTIALAALNRALFVLEGDEP